MHEGLWSWINFLGIKCIQLIKLLYIYPKQDPHMGLTTFYTCSYAYGSHKRTPLFFFSSITGIIWCGEGPIKAAIEIKHKASTSEQLNGPSIVAVDILFWSLSLRKQKGEVEGTVTGSRPSFHISSLVSWLPQLLRSHRTQSRYPKGLRCNVAWAPAIEGPHSDNHRCSFCGLIVPVAPSEPCEIYSTDRLLLTYSC